MFEVKDRAHYDALKKEQAEASRQNDYSKMSMMGDEKSMAMKKFEQDNVCTHPDVGTTGGGDYCKHCGKTW